MGYQRKLTGVIGDPVDENPTVVMVQAAYDTMQLPWQYLTIQVNKQNLEAAVVGLRAMKFNGFNCTMPHKTAIIQYLDEVSLSAGIIGAVNTVCRVGDKLYGENTDGKGFVISLESAGIEIKNRNAVLLGAGGAARAIAVELAFAGIKKITIVNRNKSNGQKLADLINQKTSAIADFNIWTERYPISQDCDILINATPAGFIDENEKPDIEYTTLTTQVLVCDILPNRFITAFMEEAQKRGCKTLDGMHMLVNQGALAFQLWTGEKAPKEAMIKALEINVKADIL